MIRKLCKLLVILAFLVILPYGITIYLNGDILKTSGSTGSNDEILKEYCIQVLANEVSSDYEEEMLKVQAILVRTTIYQEVEELGDEFLGQIEMNQEELDLFWKQKLERAWDETEGQVVMFEDQLALVPFHQVSNGKTRSGEEVLGTDEYPYLQVLECQEDVSSDKQIANHFIPVTDVSIEEWDSAGYVTEVMVGEEKMSGEVFRETYGLASSCFEVQAFEGQTRILSKGSGHGLGLSQYTANEMAKDGKIYDEILQTFFPGTEIKEVAEILWDVE